MVPHDIMNIFQDIIGSFQLQTNIIEKFGVFGGNVIQPDCMQSKTRRHGNGDYRQSGKRQHKNIGGASSRGHVLRKTGRA